MLRSIGPSGVLPKSHPQNPIFCFATYPPKLRASCHLWPMSPSFAELYKARRCFNSWSKFLLILRLHISGLMLWSIASFLSDPPGLVCSPQSLSSLPRCLQGFRRGLARRVKLHVFTTMSPVASYVVPPFDIVVMPWLREHISSFPNPLSRVYLPPHLFELNSSSHHVIL